MTTGNSKDTARNIQTTVLLEAWCLAAPLLILQDFRGLCFLPTLTCIPGGGAGSRAAAGTLGEPLPQPMPVEGWAFRGYGEGRGGLRQLVRGTEAWVFCQTIKEAEHRRIDAFELWCWRRLLRVPWTARRSNQSILKISPGCSSEGLMLKLKLQYFGHLMQRTDSLGKTLMLGKIEGGKRRG